MIGKRALITLSLCAPFGFSPQTVQAASLTLDDLPSLTLSSNWLGIHLGNKDSGAEAFDSGSGSSSGPRSVFGSIQDISSPASPPGIPGPDSGLNAQEVPSGSDTPAIGFGGNIALTADESDTSLNPQIGFSDLDVYATGSGPTAGLVCASSDCVAGSSTSNSSFFTPGPTYVGEIKDDAGVTEGVDLSALVSEVTAFKSFINGVSSTMTKLLDLSTSTYGSAGEIDNYNSGHANGDFLLSSAGLGLGAGLNIIDIKTGSNDFSLNNTNFIIDGNAGDKFIFRVEEDANFLMSNVRILVGENMDLNSVMFVTNAEDGTNVNFSNVEVNGISFWDMSMKDNPFDGLIDANNLRGCGQWVGNNIGGWDDFSVDRCAFSSSVPMTPVPIPVPAGLPLLLAGLGLVATLRMRRKPV